MAIVALLIGLVVGAAGVYFVALRRALGDRDRAALEARDAQRALAETEGALAAERGAFDIRVENAIKAISRRGAAGKRQHLHRAGAWGGSGSTWNR